MLRWYLIILVNNYDYLLIHLKVLSYPDGHVQILNFFDFRIIDTKH